MLRSWLSKPPSLKSEKRAISVIDFGVDPIGTSGHTIQSSLQIAVVYGCVSLIVSRIAALPVDVVGGPKPLWLQRPTKSDGANGLSFGDLLSAIATSMLLRGNAFLAISREGRGMVSEITCLDPSVVSMERTGNGTLLTKINGQPAKFEVLPIRYLVLPGQLLGMSPLDACRMLLNVGKGGTDLASSFFERGAVMPGVLSASTSLEDVDRESISRSWKANHGGVNRAHMPLVLEQGLTYTPIGVTPEQAQFLETRRMTEAQISAQIFHVDPTLMGVAQPGSSLTYQTVEMRERQLMLDAILPVLTRIEDALSLLLKSGEVKFNVNQTLRPSLQARYSSYQTAVNVGFLTIDEIREFEDLPPLPDQPEPAAIGDIDE